MNFTITQNGRPLGAAKARPSRGILAHLTRAGIAQPAARPAPAPAPQATRGRGILAHLARLGVTGAGANTPK